MLTEVDIERIMASQRQITEFVPATSDDIAESKLLDDDELFEMLGFDISVSETNGLI